MPPVGLEPETFAHVPQTLTKLTKRSGGPDILRIGAPAKFSTRSRQRGISFVLVCVKIGGLFFICRRRGPPLWASGEMKMEMKEMEETETKWGK